MIGASDFICSIYMCLHILNMHVKYLAYMELMPNNYVIIVTFMKNSAVLV